MLGGLIPCVCCFPVPFEVGDIIEAGKFMVFSLPLRSDCLACFHLVYIKLKQVTGAFHKVSLQIFQQT